jgi:hypothetical protein
MSHHCHWPGCRVEVQPHLWGCWKHWRKLPQDIKDDIWRSYRKGQEVTKDPSREYIEAARRAREWIFDHHLPLQQLQMELAQ